MKQVQIERKKVDIAVSGFIENDGDLEKMILDAQKRGFKLNVPQMPDVPPALYGPLPGLLLKREDIKRGNENILGIFGALRAQRYVTQFEMALLLSDKTQQSWDQEESSYRGIRRKIYECKRKIATWFARRSLSKFYKQLQSTDPVDNYMAIDILGFLEWGGVSLDPYVSEQLKRVQVVS
jgi:hypothetical protein